MLIIEPGIPLPDLAANTGAQGEKKNPQECYNKEEREEMTIYHYKNSRQPFYSIIS